MNRKIILHIGTHKTGTTALQEFLATNEGTLKECGVLIPTTGRIAQHSGHHNIAWQLNGDTRFSEEYGVLDNLCDEIRGSDCRTIVISSEDFEYLYCQVEALTALKQKLSGTGCQVEVVIFLRGWAEYVNSLYGELLKHGLYLDFSSFVKTIIAKGEFIMNDKWRFCFAYEKIVQGFLNVFGEGYVRCNAYKKPIEPEFLRIIGSYDATAGFQPVSPTNETLSLFARLALLKLNKMARSAGFSEEQRICGMQKIIQAAEKNSDRRPLIGMCVARRLTKRFVQTSNWLETHFGVSIKPYDVRYAMLQHMYTGIARLRYLPMTRSVIGDIFDCCPKQ